MKNFEYIRPVKLADAVSALKAYDNAFVLAGGTDFIVKLVNDIVRPDCVIDLKGIPLNTISSGDDWRIGAMTTIRDVEVSEVLQRKLPFLCQAASTVGSVQIRNRATIGGNLCNASPAADVSTMLLAMDSRVNIATGNGEKIVALEDFFTGPNSTILKKSEVLTEIIIPREVEQSRGLYIKFSPRKAMDIGMVNVALLVDAEPGTRLCKKIRIAMGAVAPTPIRAKQAENLLAGKILSPELIDRATEMASLETQPISDFRASANYRKALVKTIVARGIKSILDAP
jgi:CO/xanthine dehydrogenase FAD-binding subunit